MTTSLELSKQLYDKGLRLETEKWWFNIPDDRGGQVALSLPQPNYPNPMFPAPSTDELLAVMPVNIKSDDSLFAREVIIQKNICILNYQEVGIGSGRTLIYCIIDDFSSICDALAKMCLYFLDHGYHYNPTAKVMEEE